MELLTKTLSFANVFVDCVVVGWMKPTKLCIMVKMLWQFAIKLTLNNANAVFVSWCVSVCTRFQNLCTNDKKFLNDFGFCVWIEPIKQIFWSCNNESRSYTQFMVVLSWKFCCSCKLHNQIWVFDSNFEVLTMIGYFLTFSLIVLYLADWNRPNFAEWSKYCDSLL